MTDTSIIDNNVDEVDVLSEYFEVVDKDVYCTFKGVICCSLSGGVKNVLYGKTINMSEMYNEMIDDITKMIIDCDFSKDEYLNKHGHQILIDSVSKYTIKKYGVSIDWADKIVNGRIGSFYTDRIYECMINRAGGVEKIDWLRIYNNTRQFMCHNDDILMYIAKEILKKDIYRYFVNRYNLKATGIKNVGRKTHTTQTEKFIILEWDSGNRRSVPLADLVINKKEWWRQATLDPRTRRGDIQDYDVLLNGRDENEILPDVCPIDNNIVLNYTKIDFSVNTNQNITECKNHNDTTDDGFIFFHDTYPYDPYLFDKSQCGDVYKTALYIKKNFNENFEIVTLPINPGVTIVKKIKNYKQLIYL